MRRLAVVMVTAARVTQIGSQGIFGNGVANISSAARRLKNFVVYLMVKGLMLLTLMPSSSACVSLTTSGNTEIQR